MQHLNEAYEHLNHSFDTLTYQAEAAARTVRVAMGLSEPDLARQAFEYATELVPEHLQAHLFYFNVLTPKWFGDDEQLEQFVDAQAASALRPLLQAMYAVELLYNAADGTNLVQQQVRNELASRLAAMAQYQSQADDSLYAVYFNNYLACLYHALGRPQARASYLRALGARITPYPWAYYGLDESAVQHLAQRES